MFDEQMRENSHRVMFKTKMAMEIRTILTGVHTQSIEYIYESLKVSQTISKVHLQHLEISFALSFHGFGPRILKRCDKGVKKRQKHKEKTGIG